MNINILRLVARRNPAVWDVIGPRFSELNPQPIPPSAGLVALNPQPIPPEDFGALMGKEILRLGWYAAAIGADVNLDEIDNWCPSFPKRPKLPAHLPPLPDPDPEPWWHQAYLIGLVSVLAQADDRVAESLLVHRTMERAMDQIGA